MGTAELAVPTTNGANAHRKRSVRSPSDSHRTGNVRARHLVRRAATAQPERELQLGTQEVEHALRAVLAVDR